jgi:hypothetical protein
VAEALFNRFVRFGVSSRPDSDALPIARALILLGVCSLATLANPYHYRIYLPILDYMTQTGAFHNISELHPMFFRSLGDWMVLSLTVIAAFVLGWQRRWDFFYMALFALAAYVTFRARRDGWFIVLAAAAIVSRLTVFAKGGDYFQFNQVRLFSVAIALLISLYGLSHIRGVSENSLAATVESRFPVKAVEFIKSKHLQGPIFNSLDWGGYLIWSLPASEVAMDGRTNLHGDTRIARSLATWDGDVGWEKDTELLQARLIVAEIDKPLFHLLRRHSRYKLVYEDQTAALFVVNEAAH